MIELNRNHYLALGTVLVLLGVQFRFVESFMLNEQTSRFIAERIQKKKQQQVDPNPFSALLSIPGASPRKTVRPPRWLGWSLISVGAVLILHSMAMRRPG